MLFAPRTPYPRIIMLILPTTYFGPISWYRQLNAADTCYIDATEPFHKRTTRNRCTIATPNGPQTLTVPVEHRLTPSPHAVPYADTVHQSIPITSLRISEHNKWRHVHWQALETAYGNSPFFDYYADDIRPFFEPHWEYLFDLNLAIIRKMCELLQVETVIRRYQGVEAKNSESTETQDCSHPLRGLGGIAPSPHPTTTPPTNTYYQVHAHRTGFLPNLSILDLLFNMGNESILYL